MSVVRSERFWSKVDVRGIDDCWEWTGGDNGNGYGRFWNGERLVYSHRYAAGEPDAECVIHTCDNPPCCNPRHLRAGSQRENVADMHAKSRGNTGERNGMAKLTSNDVNAIRMAHEAGVRQSLIAATYGISQQHTSKIINGKRRVTA